MDSIAAPNAYARATKTANYVRSQLPESLQKPQVAIVCGSGLGGLADTIEAEPKVELSYGSIVNFPQSTGKCIHVKERAKSGSKTGQETVLIRLDYSPGPCGEICIWSDWAPEDACGAAGWTGAVSRPIPRAPLCYPAPVLTCAVSTKATPWTRPRLRPASASSSALRPSLVGRDCNRCNTMSNQSQLPTPPVD
jgi:hypothetical protein